MKKITALFLPRYIWFRLHFNQYFKNLTGIKAFAETVMNWLLRETLGLAKRIRKVNKTLSEEIQDYKYKLTQRYPFPYIDADEFPAIRGKIRSYTIILVIFIIAEAFFNFFAAKAIFKYDGLFPLIGQIMFAVLLTWGAIFIFEQFCEQLLLEEPYKSDIKPIRKWRKFILVTLGCIVYELLIYNLCKVRGIQIEGVGNNFITIVMLLSGMLIPVIAGYLAYERRRYISAYKNTLMICNLENRIARNTNRISTNIQVMEGHFKKLCQENWALLYEFRTYKENYNFKHSIPQENLHGHFSESMESFFEEAISRYKKETIHSDTISPKPNLLVQGNGHEQKIKALFTQPL